MVTFLRAWCGRSRILHRVFSMCRVEPGSLNVKGWVREWIVAFLRASRGRFWSGRAPGTFSAEQNLSVIRAGSADACFH